MENIGAKLVRQAAAKTNDLAGDGTTTSVVLAQGLITEGVKVCLNILMGSSSFSWYNNIVHINVLLFLNEDVLIYMLGCGSWCKPCPYYQRH